MGSIRKLEKILDDFLLKTFAGRLATIVVLLAGSILLVKLIWGEIVDFALLIKKISLAGQWNILSYFFTGVGAIGLFICVVMACLVARIIILALFNLRPKSHAKT